MKKRLYALIAISIASISHVEAKDWVTNYTDNAGNSLGTITLDDWGYSGPNGRDASSFDPVNGFSSNPLDPAGGIGQLQHVITNDADWISPDTPTLTTNDGIFAGSIIYPNGNMDATTNFFQWGYTTPGGGTFNNMKIDYDGDYFIDRTDMTFKFMNYFDYKVEDGSGAPIQRVSTNFAFQPYALSNAKGWCGSVLASHPNAIEPMAGQLTFDVAFDVYFQFSDGSLSYSSTEIIRGFEMRSWGDITVDMVNSGGAPQKFASRAVVNNTNPASTAAIVNPDVNTLVADPAYHNIVSFHGADVIPDEYTCGVETPEWQAGQRGDGITRFSGLLDVADEASCLAQSGSWTRNAFSSFAFLLRADGERVIDSFDEAVYGPDPTIDSDSDGVIDSVDNCPTTVNADQTDRGGVDTNVADGIGDACQCGDISGDGKITNTDSVLIKRHLLGLPSNFQADFCDVNGDGQCTNTDAVILKRTLLGLPPGINQSCPAAVN